MCIRDRSIAGHSRPSTSDDSTTRPRNARLLYARLLDIDDRNGENDESIEWTNSASQFSVVDEGPVRPVSQSPGGGA
eukprot:8753627-Alexandrium_andersonii.AAC.1